MAEHTIYTDPAPNAEGILLNVRCACGQSIGTFDDTAVGRALATSAKNQHRLAVGAPPVLPDGSEAPARVQFDVEYEHGDGWESDFGAFASLEHALAYRDKQVAEKAHHGAPMRVVKATTTVLRQVVA